jgi:hypothetical protein
MNNTVRIALAVAYAAVGIWALMPTPPKPLAAATSPPPPPPWYQQAPRLEQHERVRPIPAPRPRPEIQPDEYRGSGVDEAPKPVALIRPEAFRGAAKYPHGVSVTMNAEDHWAIVNLNYKALPPVEYDHPVTIPVEIIDITTTSELKAICKVSLPSGFIIVGCAHLRKDNSMCTIYLGPIPNTALTYNLNLRHELAHCNSWPGDHPGAR